MYTRIDLQQHALSRMLFAQIMLHSVILTVDPDAARHTEVRMRMRAWTSEVACVLHVINALTNKLLNDSSAGRRR